jgi:hypothetical protein
MINIMKTHDDISSERVRAYLLERANAYVERTGRALSFVSTAAIKDSKFLGKVANGENFTIATYQKVIDWLDEQESVSSGEAA